MSKHNGKKYRKVVKLVDRQKRYTPAEAFTLIHQAKFAKFDETVEVAIKLGVDTKKNSSIRGTISLPAGSGKSKKVAVITRPERVKEALDAGAEVAGFDDLIAKIKDGFLGFDVLIATPDVMVELGKLGKILGTKGLMPNPKTGTVTTEIAKAVKEFKGGKVEFRMDKGGVIALGIGKISFSTADLLKNFFATIAAVNHTKPSGFKNVYIKSVTISSSMGPGIKIDPRLAVEEAEQ